MWHRFERVRDRTQACERGDSPYSRNQKAAHKKETGTRVDLAARRRVLGSQYARNNCLPRQDGSRIQHEIEDHIRPAHRWVNERIEAARSIVRLDGVNHILPTDIHQYE